MTDTRQFAIKISYRVSFVSFKVSFIFIIAVAELYYAMSYYKWPFCNTRLYLYNIINKIFVAIYIYIYEKSITPHL